MFSPRLKKKKFFNYPLERDDVFIKRDKIESGIKAVVPNLQEDAEHKKIGSAGKQWNAENTPSCSSSENISYVKEENNKIKRLLKFKNKRNTNNLQIKSEVEDNSSPPPPQSSTIFEPFPKIKIKEEKPDSDFDDDCGAFDDVPRKSLDAEFVDEGISSQKSPLKIKSVVNDFGKVNLKFVDSDGSFFCNSCIFNTKYITHLEKHVKKKHPDVNIYICDICNKELRTRGILNEHVMGHLGLKPYTCSLCSYSTQRKTYLKLHMQSHSKSEIYRCFACEFKTYRNDYLNRHITTKHKIDLT